MKHVYLCLWLLIGFASTSRVWADMPSYSASPSGNTTTPTPTITQTPAARLGINLFPRPSVTAAPVNANMCSILRITSGNNTPVPATVALAVTVKDAGNIQKYRFHYGDGVVEEFTVANAEHIYNKPGTFEAFVEVEDKTNVWTTSDGCKTKVTVAGVPLLNQSTTGCSEVLVAGDKKSAPVQATLTVKGFGDVKGYQITYSDDASEAKETNTFVHAYSKPGTYEVKGYVKDAQGNYQGGTLLCKKSVYVYAAPMTTQPQTGVGIGVWIALLSILISGLSLWRLASEKKASRG